MFYHLCITLLLLTPLTSLAGLLNQHQMLWIARMGNKIASFCPKESCVVLGIGRSPTPIIAYLQAGTETEAFNLPLTGFKYGRRPGYPPLNEDQEKELFKHFGRFKLLNEELRDRSVLIIDFASTGDGAAASRDSIKKYLHHNAPSEMVREVKLLVFGQLKEERMKELEIDYYLSKDTYKFGSEFHYSVFHDFSEFGEFVLNGNQAPLISNPLYLQLVNEFKNEYDNLKIQIERDDLREKLENEKRMIQAKRKNERDELVHAFQSRPRLQETDLLKALDMFPAKLSAEPPTEVPGERIFSRGIGIESVPVDETYLDFVDGSEISSRNGTPYNLAVFVKNKETGEKISKMFFLGARVDFRPFEPNYVQVKVSVNEKNLKNLQKLEQLVRKNQNWITSEIIERARVF